MEAQGKETTSLDQSMASLTFVFVSRLEAIESRKLIEANFLFLQRLRRDTPYALVYNCFSRIYLESNQKLLDFPALTQVPEIQSIYPCSSCRMEPQRRLHSPQDSPTCHRFRQRRFSSSDSETILGDKVNTDSIEKFLSLCLHQFESHHSRLPASIEGQNLKINNLKENYVSFNDINNHSASDKPITFSLKGSGPTGRYCRYCNREMRTGTRGMHHHFEVCPKFPLECPNLCGEMELPRDELSNHIMEECTEATELCAYHNIGCSFQGSKPNLSNHLQKNIDDHLQLACEVIDDQKAELERQAERIRLQDEAIVQLNDTVVKIKTLFDEQVKLREKQDSTINKLTEQLKEHKKSYMKMEKEMKGKLEEWERDNREINNNSNDNIEELMRYPGLNGYGEQIWKISNFGKRISRIRTGRSEDPICSEPFYTSAFGYKISCWAYLNGRGKELGQSLSIYACVMSGEYDAVLQWPIKPRYTFMLLDQNPDVERRKDIVRVRKVHDFKRDDVRRKGIDRPKRDERAIIVGFDDFVSLEKLEAGDYLAEDALFIRILVDIAES